MDVTLMSVVLLNKKRFIKILQINVNGDHTLTETVKKLWDLVILQVAILKQNAQQSTPANIVAKRPYLNQM